MRASVISAALVAALVGYGSTIALVLAAARAVGAGPAETASWVAAICWATAAGSALLSAWTRVPVVLAWSTPGAALIAAASGIALPQAVGAFIAAGLLVALTGALPPLGRLVAAIPPAIASAMLAGVLLPFCMALARAAGAEPALILPLVAAFLAVRLWNPVYAALAVLLLAVPLAFGPAGAELPPLAFDPLPFVLVPPSFDAGVLLGLGLPLYLVTMASQNLPGFAVLRAAGYEPPVARALGLSGLISAGAAFFGAHTVNMAAITAAICLGPEVHPDRDRRWVVGLAYAAVWAGFGLAGAALVAVILAMPDGIVAAVAGLALITPFLGAAAGAFEPAATRFPAAVTFLVTASGVAALGVGAAFWGLLAGLSVLGLERLARR
ncbi:MAG: benzoate/H(+) symporter BenE family transporter [Rhodobacteraceae bacterium]|nr:benzoate/H(+) symporter BenE family transporter [Paracoccaceae bacterium]